MESDVTYIARVRWKNTLIGTNTGPTERFVKPVTTAELSFFYHCWQWFLSFKKTKHGSSISLWFLDRKSKQDKTWVTPWKQQYMEQWSWIWQIKPCVKNLECHSWPHSKHPELHPCSSLLSGLLDNNFTHHPLVLVEGDPACDLLSEGCGRAHMQSQVCCRRRCQDQHRDTGGNSETGSRGRPGPGSPYTEEYVL